MEIPKLDYCYNHFIENYSKYEVTDRYMLIKVLNTIEEAYSDYIVFSTKMYIYDIEYYLNVVLLPNHLEFYAMPVQISDRKIYFCKVETPGKIGESKIPNFIKNMSKINLQW